jgi:hypothetical protein
MKQFEGAKQQFGTAALTNFFQNVMYPLSLLQKGSRPNSKQLIFEKKFRKSKKKIQRPILVTFNYQITEALCRFEWNLTAGAIAFNPLITRGSGTQRVLRQMF